MKPEPIDTLEVTSRKKFRAWLNKNHDSSQGIWVVTYKKKNSDKHVPYEVIVEECLCFGWIDSKPGKVDEERSKLWCAPRKSKTGWSRINKKRIERLLDANLVHHSGLTKIEQAKEDGSWSKLDEVEALSIPADLAEALRSYPNAETSTHFLGQSSVGFWNGFFKRNEPKLGKDEWTRRLDLHLSTNEPTSGEKGHSPPFSGCLLHLEGY
jgi:uncharacterized protein YdeI (YjbR/CyaY-like superfamily)